MAPARRPRPRRWRRRLGAHQPDVSVAPGFARITFAKAGVVSAGTRSPVYALPMQACWASVLAISGTYYQLTDYVIFASWIFYALVTSAVFVLRRTPEAPRPYRTLGYPIVPLAFVLVAGWLVVNTLVNRPVQSVAGLVLIASGLPVYAYYRTRNRATPAT